MKRSVLFLAGFLALLGSDLAEAGRRSRTGSSSGSYRSSSRSSAFRAGQGGVFRTSYRSPARSEHRAVVPRSASPGGHRSSGPTLSNPRLPRWGDEIRRGEPPHEPAGGILPREPPGRKRARALEPHSRSPKPGKSGFARCGRRPPPPAWTCVLPGSRGHHAEPRCAYFCLVHCAYHLPSPGAAPQAAFGEGQAHPLSPVRRNFRLSRFRSEIPLLNP